MLLVKHIEAIFACFAFKISQLLMCMSDANNQVGAHVETPLTCIAPQHSFAGVTHISETPALLQCALATACPHWTLKFPVRYVVFLIESFHAYQCGHLSNVQLALS